MADTTHYGCSCDECLVVPMEGTCFLDPRSSAQGYGVCQACYNGLSEQKRTALHEISTYTETIKFMFQCIDADGDGVISKEEFTVFAAFTGVPPEHLDKFFDMIDSDHNGTIDIAEFNTFTRKSSGAPPGPPPSLDEANREDYKD